MTEPIRYGATPEEWAMWSALPFREDLLPLVSNPSSTMSPNSIIKKVGKTPSWYNYEGLVAGIKQWNHMYATSDNLKDWPQEPDYGICLQTRSCKAFDIDVEDPMMVQTLVEAINRMAGVSLPCRTRANSPRCLMLFRTSAPLAKRRFPIKKDWVELLGQNQQCVVAGMHESGYRYEWDRTIEEVPVLTHEQVDEIWNTLLLSYATGKDTKATLRTEALVNADNRHPDSTASYLIAHGLVLRDLGNKLAVTCPWRDLHGKQGDESQTVWMYGSEEGPGHFDCKDTACLGRTSQDFQNAIGFTLDGFEVEPDHRPLVPVQILPPLLPMEHSDVDEVAALHALGIRAADALIGTPPPDLESRPRLEMVVSQYTNQLRAQPTSANLDEILKFPHLTGYQFYYDKFLGVEQIEAFPEPDQYVPERRPLEDCDVLRVMSVLHHHPRYQFKELNKGKMNDAIRLNARTHSYDSLKDWVLGLRWDGVPRVDSFLATYLHCDLNHDSCDESHPNCRPFEEADQRLAICTAYSRYFWTALVGRALVPGIKADMMLIFRSTQGTKKSTFLTNVLPRPDLYDTIQFTHGKNHDVDFLMKLWGKSILEVDELRGLSTRDVGDIKSLLSSAIDRFRSPYDSHLKSWPRRCVFVGTTNEREFLNDTTGDRRFLPIDVGFQENEMIIRDRDQLWAEAVAIFLKEKICWRDAEFLARTENKSFHVVDEVQEMIHEWLINGMASAIGDTPFSISHVIDAFPHVFRDHSQVTQRRVGHILRRLGYEKKTVRYKRRLMKAWYPLLELPKHPPEEGGKG